MTIRMLIGDVREQLRLLPADYFDCVISSPPYWGLRDYGVEGQIGLEPTLAEHLAVMVDVFSEVRRVMKPSGTLWLNYGDCYVTTPNGRSAAATKTAGNDDRTFLDKPFSTIGPVYEADHESGDRRGTGKQATSGGMANHTGRIVAGGYLKPKDLCGIPWRVAFALQDRGWYLRQDIIWSKPNPMPESVTDRCTKAHEYIFMLTKSQRYYFDAAAIAEDAIYAGLSGQDDSGFKDAKNYGGKHGSTLTGGDYGRHFPGDAIPEKQRRTDKQRGHSRRHAGFNGRLDAMERKKQCSGKRNKRSVWTVATAPFADAHFATFPPSLIEPCILAGCPEGGTVLDPFGGAGTTGLVADRLRRNAVLIELNPAYAKMAERRIYDDAPLLQEAAE